MSISPKNSINPKKNSTFPPKDLSLNNPFLDSSGVIFTNPLFIPLQSWNNKKTFLLLEDKDNKQNNIKNYSINFDMRLATILENIREERKQNSQNIKMQNLMNIKTTLNNNTMNKNTLEPSFKNLSNTKDAIDDLLMQITKKYDLINSNDTPKLTNKPFASKIKPPLPPPQFFSRRSSTMYNSSYKLSDTNAFPPLTLSPQPVIKKEAKIIDTEINGLKDILKLIEDNPLSIDVEYNINMQSMHDIKEPLYELSNMIGMNGLKDSIVDQIIYFVQNLHINKDALNPDFMHTCIYGPPGTGKTEIAKIMGKIFSSLGVLKKKYFRKVTRADLIAGYLGQTAIKTKDVIKEALGGVLFIDEAYALGNPEKRDSFAKECIDTLCEALSDNKGDIMVIIAGYEEDLKNCFFAYNQGLNSRFPWRFKTDDYKAGELNEIFQKKIKDAGWSIKEKVPNSWFESKMDYFTYYGRDMETLLSKTKIAHGRRVFCKSKEEKTKLIMKDIQKGYEMFLDNNDVKERQGGKNPINHMYI